MGIEQERKGAVTGVATGGCDLRRCSGEGRALGIAGMGRQPAQPLFFISLQ